jgi:hypothetical protein
MRMTKKKEDARRTPAYTRVPPIYTGGSRAVVAVMVNGQESARDLGSHPNSQCEIRCSPFILSHTLPA